MVTIVMPVSRKQYLKQVFARLEMLECDREQTNLLTYVDGDVQLYQDTRNYTANSKFNQRLCVYRRKGQGSIGSVRARRQRIADIHNEIKAELKGSEYVFLIEDDTLVPITALTKLLNYALMRKDIGIVSGVELGRWGFLHVGAWRCDDVYEPTVIKSIPLEVGRSQVDGTGLYCCVTRTENYIKHTFAPLNSAIGADVQFGLALRKQGLKNYVDFDVTCTHLTQSGPISIRTSQVVIVTLQKEGEKWLQQGETA